MTVLLCSLRKNPFSENVFGDLSLKGSKTVRSIWQWIAENMKKMESHFQR